MCDPILDIIYISINYFLSDHAGGVKDLSSTLLEEPEPEPEPEPITLNETCRGRALFEPGGAKLIEDGGRTLTWKFVFGYSCLITLSFKF